MYLDFLYNIIQLVSWTLCNEAERIRQQQIDWLRIFSTIMNMRRFESLSWESSHDIIATCKWLPNSYCKSAVLAYSLPPDVAMLILTVLCWVETGGWECLLQCDPEGGGMSTYPPGMIHQYQYTYLIYKIMLLCKRHDVCTVIYTVHVYHCKYSCSIQVANKWHSFHWRKHLLVWLFSKSLQRALISWCGFQASSLKYPSSHGTHLQYACIGLWL